jgi:hypothetical protein
VERIEIYIGLGFGSLKEIHHFEDLGGGGMIILKRVLNKIRWEGVAWIVWFRDTWQAVVKTVMSYELHIILVIS